MSRRDSVLLALGVLYAVASLVHFAHNAENLSAYPNLPAWLTRAEVYGAWLGITAIGVVGFTLAHVGKALLGLMLVAIYAAIGLEGLLHYGRAPFSDHTAAMNATILFEASAAALLLVTVLALMARRSNRRL